MSLIRLTAHGLHQLMGFINEQDDGGEGQDDDCI